MSKNNSNVTIEIVTGRDIANYINAIADFRINIFKEYPYLYEGNIDAEYDYLKNYLTNNQSILVIAKSQKKIIGLATGVPVMSDFPLLQGVRDEYLRRNIDPSLYYYYGEVIIDKNFRGKKIGSKLRQLMDEKIKTWNFHNVCVFTVIREKEHALRPKNYIDMEKILEHLGFQRSGYEIHCKWPTIINKDKVEIIENTMELWEKRI